jgi:hypothetical protein
MLNDAFRKELHKFDAERVLFAWDGLLQKQQVTLEGLGVPTMFPSDLRVDREVSIEAATTSTDLIAGLLETTENSSSPGRYSRLMSIQSIIPTLAQYNFRMRHLELSLQGWQSQVRNGACVRFPESSLPAHPGLAMDIPVMKMNNGTGYTMSADYYMHT